MRGELYLAALWTLWLVPAPIWAAEITEVLQQITAIIGFVVTIEPRFAEFVAERLLDLKPLLGIQR